MLQSSDDLFLKQEDEVHGKIRSYEKKIGSLMSEVGSLKTEVFLTAKDMSCTYCQL